MRRTLIASGVLCASLLAGCNSPPKPAVPSGDWEDLPMPSRPLAAPSAGTVAVTAPYHWSGPAQTSPGHTASSALPAPALAVAKAQPPVQTVPFVGTGGSTTAPVTKGDMAPASVPGAVNEVPSVAPAKVFSAGPVPTVPTVVAPIAKAAATVPAKSLPPPPPPKPKPVWEARPGESLQQTIERWSRTAGYKVDWRASGLDYPIDAPLRFQGSYEEAVYEIFKLYEKADRPFVVDGRRRQSRLIVNEDLNNTRRNGK